MKDYKLETKKDLGVDKKVYKMNEVTRRLKLTPRTIRYYESEGLLGDVKRSIGFTRYYSDTEIARLKEVVRFKKKGYRISEIKELFLEKYPKNINNELPKISFPDVLLDKDDVEFCLLNEYNVSESSIEINNVKVNYLDWETLDQGEFLKPFKLSTFKKAKHPALIPFKESKTWFGNGHRGITHYYLRNANRIPCAKTFVNNALESMVEWLILPFDYGTSCKHLDDVPPSFLVEKRTHNSVERDIIFEKDIWFILEKHFRILRSEMTDLIKHVTFHRNSAAKNTDMVHESVKKLVPYRELLSVEELTPVYMKSLGTANAMLISVF